MQNVTNLNERTQFYASDELLAELRAKCKNPKYIVNFAYTDYGGDFMDKVLIEYFAKYHKKNIVIESTSYFGQNAFLFGKPAKEFWEAYQSYPLGYGDTEEFYSNRQYEQETEDFKHFLDDIQTYQDYKIGENALNWLLENKSGYYNITTQGIDFCESDLIDECKQAGIIEKIAQEA